MFIAGKEAKLFKIGLSIREYLQKQDKPKGKGKDIAKLVQKDIETRAKIGKQKYGERLKPFNGRNALWDAYQEALDLCMYLRQKIEEESNGTK